MRNILDTFKYLDKNGLKHLIEKIKAHDVHWTGTHAEYEVVKDTLPAYTILHFTDDYDENVQVGIYSTEETKTGELFLNKPVYRKVVAVPSPASADVNIPHGITNIDFVISAHGMLRSTSGGLFIELPYVTYGQQINIRLNVTQTDINLSGLALQNWGSGYVILEYTKTTD